MRFEFQRFFTNFFDMTDYTNDFIRWAADCVRITDKETGRRIPFILNNPQKRVLAEMERMRRNRQPIRIILLKARQWGASTLIQCYMAWMQLIVRKGWNSVLCAHVKDASAAIRGTYSALLREYPDDKRPAPPKEWALVPYEKSSAVAFIPARDCLVGIATALSPNAVRGINFHMAHLSEVAFWGDGNRETAQDIVRTICGTVPLLPDTLIAMESTADGPDSYFHDEWERAVEGKSDKTPIFVPWYEIDLYRVTELSDAAREELMATLDSYERHLMEEKGVEAERIAWYHAKRREYPSHRAMMAEFPSSPEEAFSNAAGSFFAPDDLPALTSPAGERKRSGWQRLLTVVPAAGSGKHLVTELYRNEGIWTAVADIEMRSSLLELLRYVESKCRSLHADLLICAHESEDAAAKWVARKACSDAIPLIYDDEEEPLIMLSDNDIAEGAETLREAIRTNSFRECSPEAIEAYEAFTTARARRYPRLLARMAALRCNVSTPAGLAEMSASATDSFLANSYRCC